MTSVPKLNLVGIAWPVCLLKFKTEVNDLCTDEILDVLTQDPDVVASIKMIVDRSKDALINQQREGDVYRMSIRKG